MLKNFFISKILFSQKLRNRIFYQFLKKQIFLRRTTVYEKYYIRKFSVETLFEYMNLKQERKWYKKPVKFRVETVSLLTLIFFPSTFSTSSVDAK